jgi:glutaminase
LNSSTSEPLFRIGSISKTFTYVAAMQLVAEHKMTRAIGQRPECSKKAAVQV